MFLELKVIKEWNMTPAEWREQSIDDRAQMMAYVLFASTCESYRWEWNRKKDKERKTGTRENHNPFAAMKAAMGMPVIG